MNNGNVYELHEALARVVVADENRLRS